jgi:hypothetical protein
MKLAGGAHLDRIDVTAFLKQADDYEGAGDLRDGVLKLLNTERTTHPFAVVRAGEINRWAASDAYRDILSGNYPRRSDDHAASFSDSARDAARSYKKRIDDSTDPLVGALRGFGTSVGNAADSVFDWLSRRARGGVQDTTEPPSSGEQNEPPSSGEQNEPPSSGEQNETPPESPPHNEAPPEPPPSSAE